MLQPLPPVAIVLPSGRTIQFSGGGHLARLKVPRSQHGGPGLLQLLACYCTGAVEATLGDRINRFAMILWEGMQQEANRIEKEGMTLADESGRLQTLRHVLSSSSGQPHCTTYRSTTLNRNELLCPVTSG